MVSRCSRSFERLAEVQARADEEELRARREASKASEAAAAAKRLEAELQQLRGIGSQAQPHHSRRLPPCPPPSLTPAPLSPWRPQLSSSQPTRFPSARPSPPPSPLPPALGTARAPSAAGRAERGSESPPRAGGSPGLARQ